MPASIRPATHCVRQFAVNSCEAVGFALYYFRYSSFRGRPSLWLDDLFVYPAARRQRAGQLLMRRLAELAVAADCTHMAWTASASNRVGMNFYSRIGATIVSQSGAAVTLQIEPASLRGAEWITAEGQATTSLRRSTTGSKFPDRGLPMQTGIAE